MSMFDTTTIPVLQQVVQFTETRHGVLAGNIANLDTPGYKIRDLSPEHFQEHLKEALSKRETERSAASRYGIPSEPSSLFNESKSMETFGNVEESFRSVLRHDSADVSIETQITEMAKNQAQHNLALSIMISQFRLLESAISEQV
ncbi:MAG: flagellar basal body rod protein FlgB [Pirellulales bacterium]|nr:flagellar basal body rod protein FlgB [Pirellulales bacterium]